MKTPRERFIEFVEKREAMRLHKELVGGPGPHSDDSILATYTFCNINREHDAVTKYIHEHFRVPYYKLGRTFMVRQMLFCRIFNEPAVLDMVCPLRDTSEAVATLEAYRQRTGNKVMRGAYLMPPHGKGSVEKGIIGHWLYDVVDGATAKVDYTYCTALSQVADRLMNVIGVGPFIANQVCADLRYVPMWGRSYTDWDTFILCGPGTRRGMNRFMSRDLLTAGSDQKFAAELLRVRESLIEDMDHQVRSFYADPNNLSNTFCEFDKYERAIEQVAKGQPITLRHYHFKSDPQFKMAL